MPTATPQQSLTKGQQTFLNLLRIGTGLSFRVLFTWIKQEGGPDDNPLNIGPGNSYGSATKAAVATIALLRSPRGRNYGYDKILASAAKSDNEQLKAIAESSWDAGHYGGNGQNLVSTYKYYFPKGGGSGVGDWAKGVVTDPGQALADAGDWYGGKLGFLSVLFDPKTWIRVLLVIIGAVIALGALTLFTKELGGRRLAPAM